MTRLPLRAFRLHLEHLEDRAVPSTFTVTTRQDVVDPTDGKLSLREAITLANKTPGTDMIVLPKGITRISKAGINEDANATGDFDITDSLVIEGAGAALTTVDAQATDRVFDAIGSAASPINLVLRDLTVTNGRAIASGGGIRLSNADLVVRDSVVTGNQSTADSGGGISSQSVGAQSVKLVGSSVSGNVADFEGGGCFVGGTGSVVAINSRVEQNKTNVSSGGGISAPSVTLNGCTISGNSSHFDGGGINAVMVTLTDTAVSGNSADASGGGMETGTATLTNCRINGNTATTDGGGIADDAFTSAGKIRLLGTTVSRNVAGSEGGGCYIVSSGSIVRMTSSIVSQNQSQNDGGIAALTAILTNSTVSGNFASLSAGGVGANTATLTNSRVRGNTSFESGGGILATTATLADSIVSGNTAGNGGGIDATTATLTNSTVSGNFTTATGGGILSTTATLTNSIVSDNSGSVGGGILATTATLTKSTVSGNFATKKGGGIEATTATLTNSTVSGNSAASDGGGIDATTATLTNSTVSGNFTTSNGGGIAAATATLTNCTVSGNTAQQDGGGTFLTDGGSLLNCTVVENTANFGGGVCRDSSATQAVVVRNTIIALNLDLISFPGRDVSGTFVSQGHNLIGDGTGSTGFTDAVNGDMVGTSTAPIDPIIGALRNNGGPTKTHALLAGSPAIDHGDNSLLPPTDQRGLPRRKDGDGNGTKIVDIGAFEL